MTDNDDRLVFLDENVEDLEGERGSSRNWKVLIVDDDEDVHHSTVFAMQNVLILDRPLKFLHAYTAREAVDILMHESDIAVILLDVVMETDDAGLRTVDIIRNELHLLNVRIILRTGQPGQAPELEAITSYDINEYKTKNEFTRRKLFTSLTTAIRSYNQLQQLDASRQGLEKIIEASNSFISQQGLYGFAEGVITQISGLIGVVPEGLVCAGSLKKPEEGGNLVSQWVVIAAAGKFSGYMCQDINEIRDDKIVQALKASLDRKENILINKSVSLYFETPHKQGFAVYIASDHPIKEVDQQLIQIFCSNIALYADNITMVSRLQRQAYFDGLVNLPNRAALLRELDQSILEPRVDRSLLAIIDVDQFSAINYMLGPRYGDRLLRIIGQRLKSTYPDCYVARVSSDIFAVLGDANTITPFTIKEVFREPFRFQDVDHPLTVCCGIVTLTDVAGDGSDAIQCAYVALKRAKSLGLGQQARYSAAIANETNERTRLLHELHKAFGHDRLFPVFQPQLDLKTNKVCGFEALLRWRGEDNNYIPPSQFIPISEQSSIIISLGSWILRTSLLRLKSLHNLGYEGLRMSVNVSVVQLRQPILWTYSRKLCRIPGWKQGILSWK